MSVEQVDPSALEGLWVALGLDEDDKEVWEVVRSIADYLWTQMGIQIDCDALVIGLVYADSAGDGAEPLVTERGPQGL